MTQEPETQLRLVLLERKCRWLTACCTGVALCLAAVLFMGMQLVGGGTDAIRASSFELVGDDGRLRGRWTVGNGVASFSLLEKNEKPALTLLANEDASTISIALWRRGDTSKGGTCLAIDDSGSQLVLADSTNNMRLLALGGDSSGPSLAIVDQGDQVRAVLSLKEDGSAQLEFRGEDGKTEFSVPAE